MDPKLIAQLGALLVIAAPFIIAPLASLLASLAEKAPPFPYDGQSKAGIVAALLLASLVVRAALAWTTGTLMAIDWGGELKAITDTLTAAGLAAGWYAVRRSNKPLLPGG